jgi:hypothetical protein
MVTMDSDGYSWDVNGIKSGLILENGIKIHRNLPTYAY